MTIESVTRISLPRYTIRVWRNEPKDYEYQTGGVSELEAFAQKNQDLPMREIAVGLLGFSRVTAVEVLGWSKDGVVLYAEEP